MSQVQRVLRGVYSSRVVAGFEYFASEIVRKVLTEHDRGLIGILASACQRVLRERQHSHLER